MILRKKLLIDNIKHCLSLFFYDKTITLKKKQVEYNTKRYYILFLGKYKTVNNYKSFYYTPTQRQLKQSLLSIFSFFKSSK